LSINVFRFPVQVIFGEGCLSEFPALARSFGKKALLVTGSGPTSLLPAVDFIKRSLSQADTLAVHYFDVPSDPDVEAVEKGAAIAREYDCDFVIGLGGGSPMDAAKAIAARLTNSGEVESWEGTGKIPNRSKPLICIPTTAGTGSEATSVAVITGGRHKRKMSLVSPNIYPILAIIDPELTYGMPPRLTAATGMDALTHAIESFVSLKAWEPTKVLSFQAAKLAFAFIERASSDGSEPEPRRQMSLAAFMAGMAFTTSGLGISHALSYGLGSHFGIHHGEANAILLPHVMRFNLEDCAESYRELGGAIGLDVSGQPAVKAAEAAAEAVSELLSTLPLPSRLSEAGVPESAIETLASEAFLLTRFRTSNPRDTVLEDMVQILRNAL
jgi:alcohol dehydrogenase class IV